MKTFTAALIQMRAIDNPETNLKRLDDGVREAVGRGAELVCGPEFFYFSGNLHEVPMHATPIPGPVTQRLGEIAKKHSIYFMPGTLPEKKKGANPYNTIIMFAPDGSLICKYRKRHIYRVNIPGVLVHDEGEYISGSEEAAPVFDTSLGKFGASVCYDLRFPEQYIRLAIDGAEIIFAPSAFMKETGKSHWHTLCSARALDSGSFILAPNQYGGAPPSPERYGHSLIVDPWGKILAEAGEGEEVIVAELKAQSLAEARQRLQILKHRVAGDSVPAS